MRFSRFLAAIKVQVMVLLALLALDVAACKDDSLQASTAGDEPDIARPDRSVLRNGVGPCQGVLRGEHEGVAFSIPYCHQVSALQGHPQAERAVILIHGAKRDAFGGFGQLSEQALKLEQGVKTLIWAPHFMTKADLDTYKLNDEVPVWSEDGWKNGSKAADVKGRARPSSFDVVDLMAKALLDRQRFPALKEVVFVGHSAGGQLVHRYALTGKLHDKLVERGLHVRYVVANPSHYTFLSGDRPWPNEPTRQAKVDEAFIAAMNAQLGASGAPTRHSAAACADYDAFPTGIHNPYSYARWRTMDEHIAAYFAKEVRYLSGDQDINRDDSLSVSCGADAQGLNRYERSARYFEHLTRTYEAKIKGAELNSSTPFLHRRDVIAGAGHQRGQMFDSPCGVAAIFGLARGC